VQDRTVVSRNADDVQTARTPRSHSGRAKKVAPKVLPGASGWEPFRTSPGLVHIRATG
jgi:hypothetical protein